MKPQREPSALRRLVTAAAFAVLVTVPAGPPAHAATSPFTDIIGTTFEDDIDWLYAQGITVGCAATLYCPAVPVTRGQMASFLVRMFDLPTTTTDYFSDDDGTTHEGDINRLAAADITTGCTATTFCPAAPVLRGQMASFLARAVPLGDGAGNDYFRDDDGTTHEGDIDRAAAAGIADGCARWLVCPRGPVTRGQMAAFLRRVLTPIASPPYPAPATAVLHVATSGTDGANDCRIEATPCRSITRAVEVAFFGDTVRIGPGTFAEEGLVVDVDLSIIGDPGGGTTIDATGGLRARLFSIEPGRVVGLSHLKLTGGRADTGGSILNRGLLTIEHALITGNRAADFGGAINSISNSSQWATYSTLTVRSSTIDGNATGGRGGAIYAGGASGNEGVVSITDSTVSDNVAGDGGAIYSNGALVRLAHSTITGNAAVSSSREQGSGGGISSVWSLLVVSDSTVTGNTARTTLPTGGRGGGISSLGGTVVISRSTVSGNSSDDRGGGIFMGSVYYPIGSTLALSNSTVSGNTAGDRGGGLAFSHAPVVITNSTISGNVAGAVGGGGIYNFEAVLTLTNSLVLGNDSPAQPDVTWPVSTSLASIVGIPAGKTLADILSPGGLRNNGGPTRTIALTNSTSNPARHKGDAATCAGAPVSGRDQRGLPRTPPCDIGAYELQP